MPDISYWLNQKYALLQQQADIEAKNAATNALVGTASAGLDTTRAALLPAESKAGIAKTGAETSLIGQQAKYLGPEALARISQLRAETGLTGTQNRVLQHEQLPNYSVLPESLQSIMGLRGYTGYRLPAQDQTQTPNYNSLYRY